MVERGPEKAGVGGSIPSLATTPEHAGPRPRALPYSIGMTPLRFLCLPLAGLLATLHAFAQAPAPSAPGTPDHATVPAQTLASRIAPMRHMPGLLALDWDEKAGKLYLEVPLAANAAHTRSAELLYSQTLAHGTGSNDLGLDRGQLGDVGAEGASRLVSFLRSGNKVLLMEENLKFRSSAKDAAEQASVRESFAESVLWGFKVEAEAPDGTVLLDATDFYVRDSRGAVEVLAGLKQGTYKFDATRSAVALEGTKAFAKNTVVESIVTLTTDDPKGHYVSDISTDARSLTLHERQMFVELPGPGFTPRRYSPRAGYFPAMYRDYSAPLGAPLDQNFITRHRLIKQDPACKSKCTALAPIQYYVDRGAPEPLRTALVEGARWWDDAFQAAGWAPGTFRVDLLPEGADPLDVQYNIIQWVHRYTRGWSYGSELADPRTGEVIKGNVTLGSLRGRQDYMIAEALLAPYVAGKAAKNDPALAMVLQRIRQLAAHETGHTLGLSHNFAASAYPHRIDETVSVMDYPHPWVTLDANGVPELSHAYPVGIGLWDKVAIDYGYREFDHGALPVEDAAALDAILKASEARGIEYITDEDARPLGSAHPHAHLWDNGVDAADELRRVLAVRAMALARFGENVIPMGTPLAQIEDTLVPLYLFHRYQTEAAAKLIGGLDYRYNVRGDGQAMPKIVSAAEQKKALDAVLMTLTPATLTLPESLLKMMPPRTVDVARTRESLASETGLTFDPIAAAESAADLTLTLLMNPERASRLVQYHLREPKGLSLEVLLNAVSDEVAKRPDGGQQGEQNGDSGLSSEVARAVETRAYEAMFGLAADQKASSQARAIARAHLVDVDHAWMVMPVPQDTAEAVHRAALRARIADFLREPGKFMPVMPAPVPPGMPIGEEE